MDRGYKVDRDIHPKDTASLLSLLTFRYIHSFIRRGNNKNLQEDDIFKVSKKFEAKKLGDKSEKTWKKQLKSNKQTSFVRLMISCFMKKYLLLGLSQLIVKIANVLIVPYSLGQLINYFKVGQTEITRQEACYYASTVILTNLFCVVFENQYILYKVEFCMQIFTSLCSLLYRKVLRLSSSKISEISTGKIVSAITKDISMIEDAIYVLNDIWIESIQGVIVFYLLLRKVGFAAVFGLGCYAVTMAIQAMFAKKIYTKRSSVNLESDKRFRLIQETLTSIRIIKMYTWENFFQERVTYARDQEVKKFGTLTLIKFFSYFLGSICDKMSFFAMLLFYIYLGNNLTAEVVYYTEMCFKKVNTLVTYIMTTGASVTAEFLASGHRLELILNADEIDNKSKNPSRHFIIPKAEFISVDVCSNNVRILKNLNLKLGPGLNMLVGPMGCGKSVLLKSILGEYTTTCGKLNVEGTVSYASQKPWIFPSSIKQNILFGLPYKDSRYKKVLEICALSFDLKSFTEHDETIINDCDMNLSKGQQARINLARALYKTSDIYILDDPLSSLDNRVRTHIFRELGLYLKDKLVILATHDEKIIDLADNVIVMSNGIITFTGKPKNSTYMSCESQNNNDEVQFPISVEEIISLEESACKEDSKLKTTAYTADFANIYHEQETGTGAGYIGYRDYFNYAGRPAVWMTVVALYILVEAMSGSSEKILSKWVEIEENFTSTKVEASESYGLQNGFTGRIFYCSWYTSLVLLTCVLAISSATAHFIFSLRISRNLHKSMINHVIRSSMIFFDTNMSGTILNRFSKDLYQVDEFLPFFVMAVMMTCTTLFSTAALISSVNVEFTLLTIGLVTIFVFLARYFVKPIRSLKKLENSTRSPMVGHLNATLDGLVTIRASGVEQILTEEFDEHQCLHVTTKHIFEICLRCFVFTLNLFSTLFTSLIIVFFLSAQGGESSAAVGLAITQSFTLTLYLDNGLRNSVILESLMGCFQRSQEYTTIKQENQNGQITRGWPFEGRIEYQNVNLTYKGGNDLILKNLNFTINTREKLGVVGRTGAGKSSLISTLFRLYAIEGKILIDDIDIKTVPLEFLRNQITIIPQEPLTFSGSVRDNIDPTRKYSDNQIWHALNAVNLKQHIRSLDDDINDSSISYSIGKKQLVCLARAVIRKTKIVILDEATANMDKESTILVHDKMGELFPDCTLIIIAHRLNSVMNCDRIMVMEQGEIIEFDNPEKLMQNKESVFFKMVHNMADS